MTLEFGFPLADLFTNVLVCDKFHCIDGNKDFIRKSWLIVQTEINLGLVR